QEQEQEYTPLPPTGGECDTSASATKTTRIPAETIEAIYQAYPRDVGKRAALTAIRRACKRCEPADLLAATKAYAASPDVVARLGTADEQFVPHPATWFNRDSWLDKKHAAKPNALLDAVLGRGGTEDDADG
ncbi:MAG: hypothetical protein GY851_28890, partial [bacterium]|nr:hypothetical protein [bacterium]